MKHILHSAGYHYPKTIDRAQLSKLVVGNGLVSAQGLPPLDGFLFYLIDKTVQARLITVSERA
jgi:hypothetical protein